MFNLASISLMTLERLLETYLSCMSGLIYPFVGVEFHQKWIRLSVASVNLTYRRVLLR